MRARSAAFTLIELLVVITIIVVLLALLAPALDKAVYQAELAVCGANLKAVGGGVVTYAFDHQRLYPIRNEIRNGNPGHTIKINNPNRAEGDDRLVLRGYLAINKMLLDPLGPATVDLENSDDTTHIYSSYPLWFGWTFGSEPGMTKLGNRLKWTDPPELGSQHSELSVLAGDYDRYNVGLSLSSHADQSTRVPLVLQDEGGVDVALGVVVGNKQTLSYWKAESNPNREPIDLNFAFDDGSVRRYGDVAYNEWEHEGAFVRIPEASRRPGEYPGTYNHAPTR